MRNLLFLIIYLLIVCSATAQQLLTISNILDTIEKNNPLLRSYLNKISASKELVNGANAWMPPQAGIELDKNPYSFENFYSGMVRASIMQEFPNRKVIDAKKNYFQSLSQIDLNESLYQRNKLFSEAKSAFYGIYIAQRNVQLIKESIALLKSMIELAEKQMTSGAGDLASVFKLKARLAEKETKSVHDENMILAYMATLNYLMNVDIKRVISIDTANIIKDYNNLLFSITNDSIEQIRSDVMQMNSIINTTKLDQNIVSLRSKPIFGARFEHFWIPNNPNMFSVMGTMTIPMAPWSSKGYKSEMKSKGFEIAAMQQQKENMLNMTSHIIKMLVIEMNSEYREIENYTQKVIPAYKKCLDAYLLAYVQNSADLMMALLAYDDLQMAQMEYLKHLETLLKVQVEYEKEMQIR